MTNINKLRQRCFFDISIGDKNVGRIVFELFNDICPKTCDNFRSLCTGEKGLGKTTGKPLHYKNVVFHRVVKGFIIQSGDFSMGNGKGGESIYGGTFNDENFVLKHEKPFLLSMANRGKNTNGSQFFITLTPAPHLDGVHVVFGHVLSGQEVINEIQSQATKENGRPLVDVMISNCGELIPQIKPKDKKKKHKKEKKKSEGELSTDDEDRNASKKKKKDKKHKKHKKSKDNKSDENEESNGEENKELDDINANCSVKPEEVPDIPENKFLMRNIETNESNTNEREGFRRDHRMGYRDDRHRKRKIKGRGTTRYRTPSPHHYSSGSDTPPHWKSELKRIVTLKDIISGKQSKGSDERHSRRWRNDRSVFGRNKRDFDIRGKRELQREGSEDKSYEHFSPQKRVFREEAPQFSRRLRRDTTPDSPRVNRYRERREEQNKNNITSIASDSENIEDNEVVRHSVKSEVKLNIRNRKEDSRERDRLSERRQSPFDLKNIPLPDSDPEKRNGEKQDKTRSERTFESHSRREQRHRRSSSRENTSSRRRLHSNDSN